MALFIRSKEIFHNSTLNRSVADQLRPFVVPSSIEDQLGLCWSALTTKREAHSDSPSDGHRDALEVLTQTL